jgi:predicted dienelactone hydrolase
VGQGDRRGEDRRRRSFARRLHPLCIGGAKAYQQDWKNNQQVPAYLCNELPLDPAPALDVRDPRIKAAFAMEPGIIKAFGMDERVSVR